MLELQIKQKADKLVDAIQSLPETKEFLEALQNYENDEELKSLREKYFFLSKEFQKKQYDGTLTQSEIVELRQLAAQIQKNPLTMHLIDKQEKFKAILQDINNSISNEISMDFARLVSSLNC